MSKIIEGLWDCDYCGKKGIGGLAKYCPNCGHPQSEDTKFYMPDKITYLEEEKAKEYGKGADWVCSYCDSLNRYNANFCTNCGASKEENSGDYFSKEKEREEKERKKEEAKKKQSPPEKKSGSRLKFGLILLGVFFALIMAGSMLLAPKEYKGILTGKSWQRDIAIEDYLTVKESDWEVPDGGRTYDEKEEIHHYDQEIDHYETVQVARTRTVQDGYDTSVEYVDNGDGTFTEHTVQTPRYITETYYETEQQPVYKDVPVYATKYYYEIDKWVVTRNVTTNGKEDAPYWGETNLTGKEREGEKTETYTMIFSTEKKEYSVDVPFGIWDSMDVNSEADLTIQVGDIVKINDVDIE